MDDYYERISDLYLEASWDRELYKTIGEDLVPIAQEIVRIPTGDCFDRRLGAIILLSVLAFPEDILKRKIYVEYALAWFAKNLRKNDPDRIKNKDLTAIPNKKILQFLGPGKKAAGYRINMRLRAADVLFRKLLSHDDPRQQLTLREAAEPIAMRNELDFPAFGSNDDNGDPIDSFIKRILWPSKPVIHLAMALDQVMKMHGLRALYTKDWVMCADKWLLETMLVAETYRVNLGTMFPREGSRKASTILAEKEAYEHGEKWLRKILLADYADIIDSDTHFGPIDPKYLTVQPHNFTVELEETILFAPIINNPE